MLVSLNELKFWISPSLDIDYEETSRGGFLNLMDEVHPIFTSEEGSLDQNAYVDRCPKKGIRSRIQKLISPEYPKSRENIQRFVNLSTSEKKNPVIMIIGAGGIGSGTQAIYDDSEIRLIGLDIYPSPNVNLVCDAHKIPIEDGVVDGVIIQAVLEHVFEPEQVVSEIHRVLKPGGVVYAETPFLQQVHEGAYDFTRFTESGHRQLFRKFSLVDSGIIAGSGTQLLWSIEYFTRGLFRSWTIGKSFKLLFFWLRFFDSLIPQQYNRDAASCVYFIGKSQESEIAHSDVVAFYSRSL